MPLVEDYLLEGHAVAQPVLHSFLTSLTTLKVPLHKRKRIGLRYSNTPEVRHVLSKLRQCDQEVHFLEEELADPNVLVAVLKDLLSQFKGGILNFFSSSRNLQENREFQFMCIAVDSPLDTALLQISSLVESLPHCVRHFTYLTCHSLKNLADQSAGSFTDAYTDLLLLFTPALFPSSVSNVSRFVQASRVALILINMCDKVFKPFLSAASPLSDSAYFTDEEFIQDELTPCVLVEEFPKSEDFSDESGSESLSVDFDFAMEEDDLADFSFEFQETWKQPMNTPLNNSPSITYNYYRLAFTDKTNAPI